MSIYNKHGHQPISHNRPQRLPQLTLMLCKNSLMDHTSHLNLFRWLSNWWTNSPSIHMLIRRQKPCAKMTQDQKTRCFLARGTVKNLRSSWLRWRLHMQGRLTRPPTLEYMAVGRTISELWQATRFSASNNWLHLHKWLRLCRMGRLARLRWRRRNLNRDLKPAISSNLICVPKMVASSKHWSAPSAE